MKYLCETCGAVMALDEVADHPHDNVHERHETSGNHNIEDELLKAVEYLQREGGDPQDMWVPDYGWILRNGQPTEAGLEWYKANYDKDGEPIAFRARSR